MQKLKLSELNRLSTEQFREAEKFPVAIVLDNIRSMHNVGSVFRSADAFRIAKVVLCGFTPAPPNRDIRKTALGAEDVVTWEFVQDIRTALRALKAEGYTLLAAEHTSDSISLSGFQRETEKKYAIVLGNEVDGVQPEALELCDGAIEIPQFGTKHSLNVSVAAGIFLYHFVCTETV